MNRKCRQPSRHGRKCGGRDRPCGGEEQEDSAYACRVAVALAHVSISSVTPAYSAGGGPLPVQTPWGSHIAWMMAVPVSEGRQV